MSARDQRQALEVETPNGTIVVGHGGVYLPFAVILGALFFAYNIAVDRGWLTTTSRNPGGQAAIEAFDALSKSSVRTAETASESRDLLRELTETQRSIASTQRKVVDLIEHHDERAARIEGSLNEHRRNTPLARP